MLAYKLLLLLQNSLKLSQIDFMRYTFILFFILTNYSLFAQGGDNPRGGIAIPRQNNPQVSPSTPSSGTPSAFTIKPPSKPLDPRFQIGGDKTDKSPMSTESQFISRSSEYEDRVSVKPKGESNEPYRGNQFFGEVRSNSTYIQVLARDFEYADGDRIKVLVNDRIVIPEIILTNSFRGIQLNLEPGFNKIDFEALNQGTSGPNTAEFRVYNDKDEIISSNQWNLATGFKATVIIIKENKDEK